MLGLPQMDDDEEDNHLCIKCNATIIGLDNYVKHRKNMCGKPKQALSISNECLDQLKAGPSKNLSDSTIDPFQEDRQYNLGADVFFQSLELQSSVKKPPPPSVTPAPIPSSSKSGAGVLTRRATAAILATTVSCKETYKPSESSINIVSNKRGEDWIGGHNLRVTDTDDNQTKLIKAVANICETVKKDHIPPSFNLIDEFKHDDESNEDSDESDDIEDDFHSQSEVKWKPPSSHTGGKWKPIYNTRETSSHWHSSSVITPEPDHADDSEDEHTGGKWKPFMSQSNEVLSRIDKLHEIDDDDEDVYMPPPGHTKGKWIPGAKDGGKSDKAQIMDAMALHKEGGTVQYWCGPCNRRLGSKHIYERHLASNLHMKRTLPEKELEYPGTFKTDKSNEDIGKRKSKPSLYLDENIYLQTKKQRKVKKEPVDFLNSKKKRKRRPTFLNCAVCKSKVKPFLMGKHLISHYHFRKGNPNDVVNKLQVLEHIERIVLQSPFQCSPCKFYANWQGDFLRHFRSEEHKSLTARIPGLFWCSFCKYECDELSSMNDHLVSVDHQEVAAAINRSMPIVIRKKSIISCSKCNKVFRYNIQLKRHGRMHCKVVTSTASDEYQGKKHCSQCRFTCKSRIGLSRHILKRHGKKSYYCSACSLEFTSPKECMLHRNSQSHRIREKELRREKGFNVKDLSKACPHCNVPRLKNVIELKRHIQEKHKDAHTSCPQCGMKFILPQEVTWHIRNKACSFNSLPLAAFSNTRMWNCRMCPFVTGSHAECIFHEVLHGDSITEYDDQDKKDKSTVKYACPVCHKLFLKPSLRCHLRQHTNERPYACDSCEASFTRKANLVSHVKNVHTPQAEVQEAAEPPSKAEEAPAEAAKRFLCSVCGAAFAKKYNLKQHATLHVGRAHPCPVAGCAYGARSASELRAHASTHSAARPHRCTHCDYAAKTRLQLSRHVKMHSAERERRLQCPHCPHRADQRARLERHLRLHSGDKPYACRFCTFTCNNLENLRKHVLHRNKHKDKFLYECEYCTLPNKYCSNFAKEFRVHLLTAHQDIYPNNKSTAGYVADYLKIQNVDNDQYNSDFNIDGLKFDLINEEPLKFESSFQTHDCEERQIENSVILEEFPTEGCYSVTETGTLVPYQEKNA